MEASLLAAALIACALAALAQRRVCAELAELQRRVQRATQWLREEAHAAAQLERLREVQRLAENTVATGAATVQAVHRGIAAIPFGILEAIPATRDTTRMVRAVHDQLSNLVYGGIAGSNRVVGSIVRQGLEGGEAASSEEAQPALKPPEKDAET